MKVVNVNCRDTFLKKFITGYTIVEFWEGTTNEFVKLVPMGFPVMKFHYGNVGDFYTQPTYHKSAFVVGQITRHVVIKPESGVKFVGVNLRPYSLYNLFCFDQKLITDNIIPLSDIMGITVVNETLDALKMAHSNSGKIKVIETFFKSSFLQKQRYNTHAYDEIVEYIIEKHGLLRTEELMSGKIKVRNLQRYFQKHIGIPPKLFMQIYRHKFVLSNLLKKPSFNWKDPSLDSFYYDQSHFDRDFLKFSSEKPSQYLNSEHQFLRHLV